MSGVVFSRFKGRRRSETPRPPREDEWFIPYKPSPSGMPIHTGIGYSPAPVRLPSSNILNVFTSSTSPDGIDRNYRFPREQPSNPAAGIQRLLPQHSAIHRSPSHDSLISSVPMSARLPSSSSVPTGLAAPKMLFSPLSREVRAGSTSMQDVTTPRQRTVSMPKSSRTRPLGRQQERRWAVPSMCDMFVMPRPHITPHVITPPESPDEKSVDEYRVVQEGKARQDERDDWAEYVKQRGRSLSFGTQTADPGAPVIGNARARTRENSKNNSLAKSDSRSNRMRSGSVGSRWSSRRSSTQRQGSVPRSEHKPSVPPVVSSHGDVIRSFDFVKSARCGSTARDDQDIGHRSARNQSLDYDVIDPFHARRKSEQAAYRTVQSQRPEQLERNPSSGPSNQTLDRPPRNLRIQNPPSITRGGVVVIGPESAEVSSARAPIAIARPWYRQRAQPSLDLTKPLPSIPGTSPFALDPFPMSTGTPATASQDLARTPTDASVSGSSQPPRTGDSTTTIENNSPLHARAFLAKQHQRAMTKRAFQTPAHGPSAYRVSPEDDALQSATSAIFPSSLSSIPVAAASASDPSSRRKTALEEAIGRSRAASVGTLERQDVYPVRSTLRTRPRTAEGNDEGNVPRHSSTRSHSTTPSPSSARFVPSPQLAYPITAELTPRATYSTEAPVTYLSIRRPDFTHSDTAVSEKTIYSDAPEGWSQSGAPAPVAQVKTQGLDEVPSPEMTMDDRDFHGLFFRTPKDRQESLASATTVPPPVPPIFPPAAQLPDAQALGLGYEMETSGERRPSDGGTDESTIEIATPVMVSDGGRQSEPFLGFIDPSMMGSASLQGQPGSPLRLQAIYQGASSHGPTSLSGSEPNSNSRSGDTLSGPQTRADIRSAITRLSDMALPPQAPNPDQRRFDVPGNQSLPRPHSETFGIQSDPDITTNPSRLSVSISPVTCLRHSTVPSSIHEFPSPPSESSTKMTNASATSEVKHASAFGQVVTGPPGAGKSTYCHGMHQFLTALGRPVHIINLDPAVPSPPYPCSVSITDLITLDSVMEEYGLGPNGAILYCVECLEANFDWLVEKLDALLEGDGGDGYVIFDTPGQVELWTNHDSLKRMIERLTKMDYRLAAVHLSDAHYITDASKFISVVLLALRAMMQLEMPHVNVLSKIDLLSTYGQLPFDLRYYTECQDMTYLLSNLGKEPRAGKFGALNRAMVGLVDDFGLVGFETLAVEDKTSMMKLLRVLDRVTGYVFIPNSSTTRTANTHALFSSAMGLHDQDLGDVDDVQERWIDRRDEYDELETEGWRREGEMRANAGE